MFPSARDQTPPSRLVPAPAALFAIVAVQIAALFLLGRDWVSGCEGVWQRGFSAACNSQHAADPYTFLHIGFGLALGVVFSAIRPFWRRRDILLLCVFCSAVWEVMENIPAVIDLFVYDAQSDLTYSGDSIPNSLGDTAATALGGAAAMLVPRWAALAGVLAVEAGVSLAIGDGYAIGLMRTAGFL